MRTATRKHHHARNGHLKGPLAADWLKIKNAFSDTAFDVKDTAGLLVTDSIDGIKFRTVKVKDDLATYTAKKPFKSLGIALAAGMALGLLLKR